MTAKQMPDLHKTRNSLAVSSPLNPLNTAYIQQSSSPTSSASDSNQSLSDTIANNQPVQANSDLAQTY